MGPFLLSAVCCQCYTQKVIVSYQELADIRAQNPDQRIVFADGTFDLFHLGHVEAFKKLREFGDIVVVAVLSDEWVRFRKGEQRPVMSQEERLTLVDSIRYVDYSLIAYDEERRERIRISSLIGQLKPDVFVTVDPRWESRHDEFESLGVELKVVPRIVESSTTDLLARIKLAFQ